MNVEQTIASRLSVGLHVLAVSGGVDSMVLLHACARAGIKAVVAHVNHGIRPDAADDYELVRRAAWRYGFVFYGARIRLGEHASEATARQARYGFLTSVQQRAGAVDIVTAHHADDALETVILQLQRGTYRRGLVPFGRQDVVRPLVDFSKSELTRYAVVHKIVWHEDSTNQSMKIARNRVRSLLLSQGRQRRAAKQLLELSRNTAGVNAVIDASVEQVAAWVIDDGRLVRWKFAQLPHSVCRELLAFYLRNHQVEFDSMLLERLTVALKVQKANSRVSVGVSAFMEIHANSAKLLVQ